MIARPCHRGAAALTLTLALGTLPLAAQDEATPDRVAGHLLQWSDDGGWSWFGDERAVVDAQRGQVLVGSCASGSGAGGEARGGDVDVAWLELERGRFRRFVLHDRLEADDHDSPALLLRPDGRLVAMYSKHSADRLTRYRSTVDPGDPSRWTAERSLVNPGGVTYANLHHLADANGGSGVTYGFTRTRNFDPNVIVSWDGGETWTTGGKLLTEGGGGDRPYVKYASDGRLRVHLLATERHPRDYPNGIYHGYVEERALFDSQHRPVDADVLDRFGRPVSSLTRIFASETLVAGSSFGRAWPIDLALDPDGLPRALFQVRADDRKTDHRLMFSRFDGLRWSTHEVCRLGSGLYAFEGDYTGLAALDPDDPGRIYVATPVDPRDGSALAHHEIFVGTTPDDGATWSFAAITERSSVDNLRPIVPAWSGGRTALLWLRGTYTTYTDYDLAVVGVVEAPELRFGRIAYVDASAANTRLASGAELDMTGPSSSRGPADGRWHERWGWGNAGSVLTADESGSEDVPLLRTELRGLGPGRYDTFVFFWSSPEEDWLIRAGLEASALRTFRKRGSETVTGDDMDLPIVADGSGVALYKAYVGRASVGESGRLDLFVDDLAAGQTPKRRTWYDGVGLAPVLPDWTAVPISKGPKTVATRPGSTP